MCPLAFDVSGSVVLIIKLTISIKKNKTFMQGDQKFSKCMFSYGVLVRRLNGRLIYCKGPVGKCQTISIITKLKLSLLL